MAEATDPDATPLEVVPVVVPTRGRVENFANGNRKKKKPRQVDAALRANTCVDCESTIRKACPCSSG